jgi:hypothetical protein
MDRRNFLARLGSISMGTACGSYVLHNHSFVEGKYGFIDRQMTIAPEVEHVLNVLSTCGTTFLVGGSVVAATIGFPAVFWQFVCIAKQQEVEECICNEQDFVPFISLNRNLSKLYFNSRNRMFVVQVLSHNEMEAYKNFCYKNSNEILFPHQTLLGDPAQNYIEDINNYFDVEDSTVGTLNVRSWKLELSIKLEYLLSAFVESNRYGLKITDSQFERLVTLVEQSVSRTEFRRLHTLVESYIGLMHKSIGVEKTSCFLNILALRYNNCTILKT